MNNNEILAFHDRFCEHASTFKGHTKKTISWYKDAIRSFLLFQPITQLDQITQQSAELWILEGKKERNWSAKTIRERLKSIKLFCDWLVRSKYVASNPLNEIELPKLLVSLI